MAVIDPVLANAYQEQITRECGNWAAYKALANRAEIMNLDGFAKFFHDSAADELTHAQKFRDFLIDRNIEPQTYQTAGYTVPPTPNMIGVGTILFSEALRLEMANTEKIRFLYEMAAESRDEQSYPLLLWFIDEQTRSERELVELVARAKFAEGCASAVLKLVHELKEGE